MLIVHVFVVLASILKACSTATAVNEADAELVNSEAVQRTPFYPRNAGIANSALNCYMSSLFSCLYSIPMMQSHVYEMARRELETVDSIDPENDSLIVALARVFAKMRVNKRSISLAKEMFLTLAKEMGWSVGEKECVVEFWDKFIDSLPENDAKIFKEIFEIETKISFEDGKCSVSACNYLTIDITDGKYDIMSLLTDKYLSKNGSDLVKEEVTNSSFGNSADLLVFRILRNDFDNESQSTVFYDDPIYPTDVRINDTIYIPMAYIVFNVDSNHYYAVTMDYETKTYYLHNDEIVEEIVLGQKSDNSESSTNRFDFKNAIYSNSVMMFYAKESSLKTAIEEIREAVKSNLDIPPQIISKERIKLRKRPAGLRRTNLLNKNSRNY